MKDRAICRSYAKVNLFLQVISRTNTWHQLHMVNVMVDLFDEVYLNVQESETFSLHLTFEPDFPELTKTNSIQTAFDLYRSRRNLPYKFNVHVKKNIPPGTGLGGGSSNAAIILKYLNQQFDAYNEKELYDLGLQIGSDVPYCLYGKPAQVIGRGEGIRPLSFEIPQNWMVLVIPNFICSTAEAYKSFDVLNQVEDEKLLNHEKVIQSWQDLFPLKNDLIPSSCFINSEISKVLERIKETMPYASSMSGSGSSCFGIFLKYQQAVRSFEHLKHYFSKIFLVQMIK